MSDMTMKDLFPSSAPLAAGYSVLRGRGRSAPTPRGGGTSLVATSPVRCAGCEVPEVVWKRYQGVARALTTERARGDRLEAALNRGNQVVAVAYERRCSDPVLSWMDAVKLALDPSSQHVDVHRDIIGP